MSWPRAGAFGALLVAVAFGALVYVPDLIVSSWSGVARGTRVMLATAWFTAAVVGMLWALRRLQARGLTR